MVFVDYFLVQLPSHYWIAATVYEKQKYELTVNNGLYFRHLLP